MNWRAAIPNALTLGNLACGVLALLALSVFRVSDTEAIGGITVACILVGVAALFDVLDGAVARLLRTSSALGAQLDSLADVVSFGVVPTVMMLCVVHAGWTLGLSMLFIESAWPIYLLLTAPALATAYRLARFNIQHQSSSLTYFEGLPSPASGMLLAACCIMAVNVTPAKLLYNTEIYGMPVVLGFMCALAMVSRWPFLSFKGSMTHKLALVGVFATGALVAWLSGFQPWSVLATLVLYAVVSRVLIRPIATPTA